jgi:hypothetical protein
MHITSHVLCVCTTLPGHNFNKFCLRSLCTHSVYNPTNLQDQMLYHFLIQRLQLFLPGSLGGLERQNAVYTRTGELEETALTLDILLATMQNSDSISDKIQASIRLL